MAKSNLPAEVHDHFRKANMLHTYVVKSLGEATEHALETGQELLLAKESVPHGSWETECERLFAGSLRTARFYMSFAKDMLALPKNGRTAVLFLETTLEGAAKAARDAARGDEPPKRLPAPQPTSEPDIEVTESEEWVDEEPAETPDDVVPLRPRKGDAPKQEAPTNGQPPKQYDRGFYYKQWNTSIGPLIRMVDKMARDLNEMQGARHRGVKEGLDLATRNMIEWMGVKP